MDKVKGVLAFEGTGAGEQELIPGVWAGLVTSTYGDDGDEYQSKFSKVTADKKYLLSYKNMQVFGGHVLHRGTPFQRARAVCARSWRAAIHVKNALLCCLLFRIVCLTSRPGVYCSGTTTR